ncbi:HPP family protein [Nocardiopsis potens]|uniref:HPP family protein n=1 Tax=Nocardiopsis potens TaxID=1246458 RepID=UPI000346DB12|nr:HPP family protein [Nocardiopsis potens]
MTRGRPGRARRRGPAAGRAAAVGGGAALALGAAAALAAATGEPLLFPSLGPTVYLLFADPLGTAAAPRNIVLGHLVGIGAGVLGLAATGLTGAAPDLEDATWERAAAAVIAIGLTCALMPALGCPHPPAGATTLIVALGLLRTPHQLAAVAAGVVLVTAVGHAANRAAGVPHPPWRPRPSPRAG